MCTSITFWIAAGAAIGIAAIYATWTKHWSCAWCKPRVTVVRKVDFMPVPWKAKVFVCPQVGVISQGWFTWNEGVVGIPLADASTRELLLAGCSIQFAACRAKH